MMAEDANCSVERGSQIVEGPGVYDWGLRSMAVADSVVDDPSHASRSCHPAPLRWQCQQTKVHRKKSSQVLGVGVRKFLASG